MQTTRYLYLNYRDEFYRVDISKIVYFESEGNYTNFILSNGTKGVVCTNLASMQKVLGESLREASAIFARVGKRFIINLNHVFHIEVMRQRLVLSDGATFSYTINISKDALRKLKDLYTLSITRHRPIDELIQEKEQD